jgi:hypothetical protein
LSCLLKRGQSARCCDDLAQLESRLSVDSLHGQNSFRWFCFLLPRGTAESGALKANALPGGARRLAVRAVKAAWFSRSSERSGRALIEEAGGPGAGFQQEGQNRRSWVGLGLKTALFHCELEFGISELAKGGSTTAI